MIITRSLTAFLLTLLVIAMMSVRADDTISQPVKIYQFDIREEIAPPVQHRTEEAFREALDLGCNLVLIHMNTYGGMLNSADTIRSMIMRSPIPVYVFIDNNAASAGALISIACDSIYMAPGANIGAATVVDQTGKPLPDKYQSYMRSMMRSTAEAKGRDPDIAQAMVDPRVAIEGIVDTGQVLTFTATEAMKYGFCEGIAESVPEVLEQAGIKEYEIIKQSLSWIDKVILFLVHPMVSGILIMIIIGGIYFELQSPGIGFPLAAAAVAAILYFAPLYLEGLAEHWEILLFIGGLILIAVEIFAIPGFGVPGILGIVLILGGLTLSLVGNIGFDFEPVKTGGLLTALFTVVTAMFVAIIFSFWLSKKMFTTTIFGHLALDKSQESSEGYTVRDRKMESLVGQKGVAFTVLRPSGKVKVGDVIYDATSETGFIEKGTTVRITGYQTTQIFVEKPEEDEK
ncbi:MAG: nodulation protein NfeD [Bacteroidales bacterium]